MSIRVNMHEAKSRLSSLVEKAEAGELVVIARRGRPVVRLVPFSEEEMFDAWEERNGTLLDRLIAEHEANPAAAIPSEEVHRVIRERLAGLPERLDRAARANGSKAGAKAKKAGGKRAAD